MRTEGAPCLASGGPNCPTGSLAAPCWPSLPHEILHLRTHSCQDQHKASGYLSSVALLCLSTPVSDRAKTWR